MYGANQVLHCLTNNRAHSEGNSVQPVARRAISIPRKTLAVHQNRLLLPERVFHMTRRARHIYILRSTYVPLHRPNLCGAATYTANDLNRPQMSLVLGAQRFTYGGHFTLFLSFSGQTRAPLRLQRREKESTFCPDIRRRAQGINGCSQHRQASGDGAQSRHRRWSHRCDGAIVGTHVAHPRRLLVPDHGDGQVGRRSDLAVVRAQEEEGGVRAGERKGGRVGGSESPISLEET